MRVRIIGLNAQGLTKLGHRCLLIVCLREHQSHVVVRLGGIRAQPGSLAELRQDFLAACTLASQQEAEHVVRFGVVRLFSQQFANTYGRRIPVRGGARGSRDIEPGLELPHGLINIACAKKKNSEVDVYGGRRRK